MRCASSRRCGVPVRDYEISLTGVRAYGHHGVLPEERRDGQEFVIDVHLEVRRNPSDDLATTVNYAALAADLVGDVGRDPVDLIETLADRLAARCVSRPGVERATVVVHKPHAPVGVPFGDVSVAVTRGAATRVVLSLGSNVGDSLATLRDAVERLCGAVDALAVTGVSPVYRTAPVGGVDQDDYLNIVVTAEVTSAGTTPAQLLELLHDVERRHGRTREVRWGPRTLDIDIIRFGDVISDDPDLTLPHPRAHERAFVLVPWLDVDPDATLPGHGRVADLVAAMDASGVRRLDDVRIEAP